jgi:hypothetical protein
MEAAHILPDGHPLGEPVISNGLALCKLHHAAFDAYIIGVTPDLEVTVRLDVLQEIDGPMLQHGLQGFPGRRIHVPRADHLKPNRDFLAERYALLPDTSFDPWQALSNTRTQSRNAEWPPHVSARSLFRRIWSEKRNAWPSRKAAPRQRSFERRSAATARSEDGVGSSAMAPAGPGMSA